MCLVIDVNDSRREIMEIKISDFAWEYLKKLAEPFVDQPGDVLDRVIRDHAGVGGIIAAPILPIAAASVFGLANLPDVSHTEVVDARIEGKLSAERSWQHVMGDVVTACIEKGVDKSEVIGRLFLNHETGLNAASGHYYVPAADITIQGSAANRILKQIAKLAESFQVSIEIKWRWYPKDQAAFPGQGGSLVFP
jgi:hypothetical protein